MGNPSKRRRNTILATDIARSRQSRGYPEWSLVTSVSGGSCGWTVLSAVRRHAFVSTTSTHSFCIE